MTTMMDVSATVHANEAVHEGAVRVTMMMRDTPFLYLGMRITDDLNAKPEALAIIEGREALQLLRAMIDALIDADERAYLERTEPK